jgi:ankyrin repeat protein
MVIPNLLQNTLVRSKGELLGEIPFFFRLRHIFTAQVGKLSAVLYVLSLDAYQQVCKSYTDDNTRVLEVVTGMVERSGVTKSQSSWNTALQQDCGAIESAAKVKQTIDDAIKRLGERNVVSFVEVCSHGNIAAAKQALETGSLHVDVGDYDLRTALHLACSNGYLPIVKLLVEKFEANHNVRDRYNGTPLADAIREKHPDVVSYLKEACNAHIQTADYIETFIQAAADNNIEMLKMLLAAEMDVNCYDYDHRTALHLAVSEKNTDAIKFLLDQPGIKLGPVDRVGNTPLWDAIIGNDQEAAKLLAERGAPIQGTMAARMCAEAAANNVQLFQTLVSNGVDIMRQVRSMGPIFQHGSLLTSGGEALCLSPRQYEIIHVHKL